MGEVYRARDTRLGAVVAIVCLEPPKARFDRERAISALNHPNICTPYDIGPDYLVMELVEGDRWQSVGSGTSSAKVRNTARRLPTSDHSVRPESSIAI
jgi:serine/threonine protein kinase